MELLRALFPFSFTKKENAKNLVIQVVIHVIAMIVVSVVATILGFIPIVNMIVGIVASLADLYLVLGIVFTFLNYFKIGAFKD